MVTVGRVEVKGNKCQHQLHPHCTLSKFPWSDHQISLRRLRKIILKFTKKNKKEKKKKKKNSWESVDIVLLVPWKMTLFAQMHITQLASKCSVLVLNTLRHEYCVSNTSLDIFSSHMYINMPPIIFTRQQG